MLQVKRNLQDWLSWQETLHPKAIDLGLERVRKVYQRLAVPPPAKTVITVGGTNGKGSCVALLNEIYHAAGYRVGAYTSPHVLQYNERVSINKKYVTDQALCEAFEKIDKARQEISLTYFEFGTLAALICFAEANLDVVILEVGLGGRLDATNIIDADIALIATVDLDHEEWLGDTRDKIAVEKAGILRSNKIGIYGDFDPPASLIHYGVQHQITLRLLGKDYHYQVNQSDWKWQRGDLIYQKLPHPNLKGEAQYKNAAAVLAVITELQSVLPIKYTAIEFGLRRYTLLGRYFIAGREPTVILDVAHNPQAIRELVATLTATIRKKGRIILVFGVFKDKNVREIIRLLAGIADHWCIAGLDSVRAMAVDEIASTIEQFKPNASIERSSTAQLAYQKAISIADKNDTVVVTGSFLTVSAVMNDLING